jgi:hypothetical protein
MDQKYIESARLRSISHLNLDIPFPGASLDVFKTIPLPGHIYAKYGGTALAHPLDDPRQNRARICCSWFRTSSGRKFQLTPIVGTQVTRQHENSTFYINTGIKVFGVLLCTILILFLPALLRWGHCVRSNFILVNTDLWFICLGTVLKIESKQLVRHGNYTLDLTYIQNQYFTHK